MSHKHLMIAVNWFGPYWDLAETREVARNEWDHALYMCIGMRPYQRKPAMQYVGIGKSVHTRMTEDHHKLKEVTRERQIWLGEIATAEPGGRKLKVTAATLDYAEWLHARFMQLPLNEKKTKTLPPRSVTVLNKWWKRDYETPRRNRPHPDWPDLIDYPHWDSAPARMVWFGRRQQLFSAPDYASPRPAVRPSKRDLAVIEAKEEEELEG